jgi:hypothetical protein
LIVDELQLLAWAMVVARVVVPTDCFVVEQVVTAMVEQQRAFETQRPACILGT